MNKIFFLSILAFTVFACKSAGGDNNSTENTASRSATGNKYEIASEEVRASLSYLASDELKGRASGEPGLGMAAEYAVQAFEKHGVKPFFESYLDTLNNFDQVAYNVVGVVPGIHPELKDEYVLVGAHYDHIGVIEPQAGDSIANGANDNASGSVAVMELAKYFGSRAGNKRSVIFALFAAEENGLKGAKHLAEKLKQQGTDIYMVLNLEMIGVPMQRECTSYLTGFERSNMGELINNYAGSELTGFLPQAREYNLFRRSDNYAFYEIMGVPAQTLSTFDFTNFEFYHKVGDEAQLMDVPHMTSFIKKLVPVVEGFSNSASRELQWSETEAE
ncbi:M28 family peptidase [Robertkochia aurantiaca]|uniref:M28 family peptidase n=1 Tax=Robertkochia aurantiaca TaxID=2873700 RepID=UPI001CCAA1B9|nr:M28 family peptidase [Robertkochia sp. 3YJGBD-33]